MSDTKPVLRLEGIVKTFPGVRALDGVSFDVRPGEVHALMGENGAGKSTLMKVLAGMYRPNEGHIHIDDRPVVMANPIEAKENGVILIHQELSLAEQMTVAENVFLGELPRSSWGFVDWKALDDRVGTILNDTLCARRDDILRAIDALRLQYPEYSDALETQFLRMTGFRLEDTAYATAHSQALIGAELYNDLHGDLMRLRQESRERPDLDLGLQTKDLLAKHALFTDLSAEHLNDIARMMRPTFATPGEKLMRKGERGDLVYFIASGAVEVRTGADTIRLGRGDVVGEMALVTGKPRSADVTALGYCQLLGLSASAFRTLLQKTPELKAHMDRLSSERQSMNAPAPKQLPEAGEA